MSVHYPTLWIGPAGSGKLTAARAALGLPAGTPPRLQMFEVGDYHARYWEFPTHMEIDVLDLSLMDKRVLPDLLAHLLSTREVMGGDRKMLILRRIHGLSPAAAGRLRAVLEEYVWSSSATATIWATARIVNSVVASVMDGFLYRRVPGVRRDRISLLPESIVATTSSLQTYVAEVLRQMVTALTEGPPCLEAVIWMRSRVYEMLGLMITGAELVSGLTWATVRLAAVGSLASSAAKEILALLAGVRWFPSYRTPLMMEQLLTDIYGLLASHLLPEKVTNTIDNHEDQITLIA